MISGILFLFCICSAVVIMINDWDRAVHPNQRKARKFGEGMFQDVDTKNWFSPIT